MCSRPAGGVLAPGQKVDDRIRARGDVSAAASANAAAALRSSSCRRRSFLRASARASCPCWGFAIRSASTKRTTRIPKEYRDDFYEGQTDSFIGARTPFTTQITVTGPADFTINSVGTKTAEDREGWRAARWSGRATFP